MTDANCQRETKRRIATGKDAFSQKEIKQDFAEMDNKNTDNYGVWCRIWIRDIDDDKKMISYQSLCLSC